MSPELLAVRKRIAERMAKSLEKETGIPVTSIMGRERDSQVVRVRHQLWLSLYDLGMSMAAIGEVVDRDHTSVLNGIEKARWREQQRNAS